MFVGPVPRQHGLVVRFAGQQAFEDVVDVGSHVDVVAVRTAGQRQEAGDSLSPSDAAREEPVLAALACSPKPDPDVTRVDRRESASRLSNEEARQATQSRADRQETSRCRRDAQCHRAPK